MNKLRILMLTTDLGNGGAEKVFHQHAADFAQYAEVEEVVYDRDQGERVYDSGLPLHDLKRSDFWSRLGPFGRLVSRSISLRNLVATGKFHVVISHMDGANWVNVLSRSSARKILVVHGTVLHDRNVSNFRQWLRMKVIFPWIYNQADCTVAVSEGIARELRTLGKVHNVHAIPNYFELGLIRRLAESPLAASIEKIFVKPPILVSSGRLAKEKRQSALLDMLAILRQNGSSARLIVLGDGELRESLLLHCAELGLTAWAAWEADKPCGDQFDVYFMGYVPNPYQYLSRSTLFLFPSAWEGFPLALCEAMILGLPVLSADCPTGPREIIAPGTVRDSYDLRSAEFTDRGALLPMINSQDDLLVWVNAINRLITDGCLRSNFGENGIKSMGMFDHSVVKDKWANLLSAVLR